MIPPRRLAEHFLVPSVSCSENGKLYPLSHYVVKRRLDKVKALVRGKTADHNGKRRVGIWTEPQLFLKEQLVALLFLK